MYECKNTLVCVKSGDCCQFNRKDFLTEEEDLKLKGQMYLKTGIIYLYPFSRYTISLSLEEKKRLEKEAKKQGKKIKILPKKIFYDLDNDKVHVIDYFLDKDGPCTFYEGKCTIYEKRPAVCRHFPKKDFEHKFDLKKLIGHTNIRLINLEYKEIQKIIKEKLTCDT